MIFESKSYTFKVTPDLAELLNATLTALDIQAENPRDAITLLARKKTGTAPDVPAKETEEYQTLQTSFEALTGEQEALTIEYDTLKQEHAKLSETHHQLLTDFEQAQADARQAAETIYTLQQQQIAPENTIVIELDAATFALLSETCRNLRAAADEYPALADFSGVTPAVLLVSMFRRYVKERLTEWFFPLAIMPAARIAEIEERGANDA